MSFSLWYIVGGLVALLLIWGFAIEPSILTVTQRTLRFSNLPDSLRGMRVVFFADVHAGPRYSEASVERLAKKIDSLHPDLLLFGGDLLHKQSSAEKADAKRIADALGGIRAPLGKFAVYGNHDVYSARTEEIAADILKQAGFVMLDNSSLRVADDLSVAGTRSFTMTNYEVSRPDPEKALAGAEGFVILLSHEPDQFLANLPYAFDLQLSGHSHGGQVSLPLVGPILLPEGSRKFPYGEYERQNRRLFVTRGIGTSILRVRFNAPPEIVVLTLEKAE